MWKLPCRAGYLRLDFEIVKEGFTTKYCESMSETTFAPVKYPLLESASRNALMKFDDEMRTHRDQVEQWKSLGHKVEARTLKACIDRKLLRRLCALELKGKDPEEVDDGTLKELLAKLKGPRSSPSQNVEALFSSLRCDMTEKDPRERVSQLFGEAIELRQRETLTEVVSDKQLAEFIVRALRPDHFRKAMECDLSYQHKGLHKDITGLFEHVAQRAEAFEEVYRATRTVKDAAATKTQKHSSHEAPAVAASAHRLIPSERPNFGKPTFVKPDEAKKADRMRAPRDGCLKCKGDNWLKNCPLASPAEKVSLLEASRQTRSNAAAQAAPAPAIRKVNAVHVSEEPSDDLFIDDCAEPILYLLDSGAGVSVIPQAVLERVAKASFVAMRRIQPPWELTVADGLKVLVSQVCRVYLL